MSFGDNLRALIEERDITQKELAKKLNIAPSTLGSYVQNVREPDFATLKMFANFFDVSTDYLLDHSVKECSTRQENELLRVFRSLSEEQQYICIEQSKVFMLVNQKRKEETKAQIRKRTELYLECQTPSDGKKPDDRRGSISTHPEMQHGFRNQHGRNCTDVTHADV